MVIKVVTDSTADLPTDITEDLGIEVVPLNVHFGVDVYKDKIDLAPDRFYDLLLNSDVFPTTSQPSVGEFLGVYERLAPKVDGIVSVHVSEKVSGTMNSARLAAQQLDDELPIEVIDTYQASMGVGLIAIEAAKMAKSSGDLAEVTRVIRNTIARCQCFAMLDTLEYLQKGGRIGKASAMLGNLLRIRPLLIFKDGEVHELGKERTRRKGVAKLLATAESFAPLQQAAVMYSTSKTEADLLIQGLSGLMNPGQNPYLAQLGPTIGTYGGPDALGIAVVTGDQKN